MAERAYITPKVLKWARTSAKMTLEQAAAKVSVSTEKVKQWEDGNSYPTIRQAQKLAKSYRRPFAVFFLPDVPRDFQPLTDYRKSGSVPLSTASIFLIREIQKKQAWISEQNKEEGFEAKQFVGRFSLSSSTEKVAKNILEVLGIDPLRYETNSPINEWISKAERIGIFVSRTSFIHSHLTLDKNEIQGFAISDPFAPFIFINTADWKAPQLFTLVHELAHIWIASSGISNAIEPESLDKDKSHPIEQFCNRVAAEALIPKEFLIPLSQKEHIESKQVFQLAHRLGVSSLALLVRLKNLNLLSGSEYFRLKEQLELDFQAFLEKEDRKKLIQKQKDGGPNYYLLQIYKNSRLFTEAVLDAFNGGRLEPNFASDLLNVKASNFPKLAERLSL